MSIEPLKNVSWIERFVVRTFLNHESQSIEGTVKQSQQFLHHFMVGDVVCSKSLKLIGYISEAIDGLLDVLIVKPLEAVEEIPQNINSGVVLG
jgi:hypothetical protein